ncbi:MAG: hypothetical protein HKL85_04165 [Acidimicrobiaceae bacterium]|nr:hypothetical protein [Acidimicrobiaceae bacterium]
MSQTSLVLLEVPGVRDAEHLLTRWRRSGVEGGNTYVDADDSHGCSGGWRHPIHFQGEGDEELSPTL